MNESGNPICPQCHQSDRNYKVSDIYSESLRVFDKKYPHPVLEALFANKGKDFAPLPDYFDMKFTRLFTPPTGNKTFIPAIHPDLIVFMIFMLISVFLYFILNNHFSSIIPIIIAGIIILLIYLFFRKDALITYHEIQKNSRAEPVSKEEIVRRWLKLYYCSRDGIVFDPEKESFASLSTMNDYFLNR